MKNVFRRLAPVVFILCLVFFASSTASFAQSLDTVTISGRVADPNNAPIVGASVTATLVTTGVERTVVTDDEGRYRIVELQPGTYTVKSTSQGFGIQTRSDLVTISGQNLQLDFALAPAGVTAEQTVTIGDDDAPAVDTTRTVVGGTVTEREIEELPNNSRNPLDLVFTLGGVTEEALSTRDLARDRGARGENAPSGTPEESGVFSLSGGAAYSNNITVDGLDNNDDRAATFRFQPSTDSIAEVQVITNQFSAEYGRASGGRVNFRTRAGTKDFRGRLAYYFRDESLNANTYRNNSRVPRIERPALQENIPVFTFGGPIPLGYFKNKTFFFAAYEYQNVYEDTQVDTFVPVQQNQRFSFSTPTNTAGQVCERASITIGNPPVSVSPCVGNASLGIPVSAAFIAPYIEAVPTPLRNHTFSTRIDHNFNDDHRITFNLQYGKRNDFRQFSGGSRLAEALIGNSRKTNAYSLTDNYVLSSSLVNEARFQYSTLKPKVISDTDLTAPVIIITLPAVADRGSSSLVAGSSTTGSSDRNEDRWQFQDFLTYLYGSHSFKFGGDIQRVKSTFIDRGDATGTFSFSSSFNYLNNTISRFRQNFGTTSTQQNTYTGFFFQDEWRLRPNFTLSYGLRYENESIIDDKNNFGPRFAIAYSPFEDGKGVIRFGAGIFYNRALLRTIDDFSLTASTLIFDTNNIPFGGQRDAVLASIGQGFPNALTQAEAQQICTANNIGCGTAAFGRVLDPNLVLPESYQANLGFERDLGNGFVVEANYTYNKTVHLWREFNANAPRIPAGFNSLADFLLSRDFNNAPVNGVRPLYNVNGAQNTIRFVTSFTAPATGDPARCPTIAPTNADQGGCRIVNGVPVTFINLNSVSATNTSAPITVALAAVQNLRPDPTRTQLEQLASIGNSEYHGLILEMRRRYRKLGYGFGASFRAAYTLSSLRDDGVVNTSSAQISGDFRSEFSRALQDRRHRFVFSGAMETPNWLGKLRFSPIVRVATGAPFNLSGGGFDRNLDDVNNDRPDFNGDFSLIRTRNAGEPFPQEVFNALTRPTIGARGGNLPRNSGIGPGLFLFDLSVSREFKFTEKVKLRPNVEFNNVLNATVFSFGTAFINATDPQATFLVPNRTYRPREIRLGLRLDF